MKYKVKSKSAPKIVIFLVCILLFMLAACVFKFSLSIRGAISDYENSKNKALQEQMERLEYKFSMVSPIVDNTFFINGIQFNMGTTNFYFSYQREDNNFIVSAIDFCNILRSDVYPQPNNYSDLTDESEDYILYINNNDIYLSFANKYKRVDTNVFMEDYTMFENFERIRFLQINAFNFTDEQLDHLNAISSDYSFEINIRH